MGAQCPKCHEVVALHEGRPNVSPDGVELWHLTCWSVRHARPVEEVTIIAPRSVSTRLLERWRYVAGGAAVLVMLGVVIKPAKAMPLAATTVEISARETIVLPTRQTSRVDAPPVIKEPVFPVPIIDGVALDEQYPSLLDWIHPVTGTLEKVPAQASRHFGAERKGIERSECGAGHCGIDLDGPEGRPVVAVSDGVVVRVERHELGLDGKSGRYVRIEHDDGTLTAYMHLDEIVDGLEVGDHVDGGQYIGTLGATAVYDSVPHLHFSLEVPNVAGTHGDNTNTHYVDPAPFLARAAISPMPERKHAIKPAM